MMLAIAGDGFPKTPAFYSRIRVRRRRELSLRVDDLNNPAFWLKITIEASAFRSLAGDRESWPGPDAIRVEGRHPATPCRLRIRADARGGVASLAVLDDLDPAFRVRLMMDQVGMGEVAARHLGPSPRPD